MGSFHASLLEFLIDEKFKSAARLFCFNCRGSVSRKGSQLLCAAYHGSKELIPRLLKAGANPCDTSGTQHTCAFSLLGTMAEHNDPDLKIFKSFVVQFQKKKTRPCVRCVRELVGRWLSAKEQKQVRPRAKKMMRYMRSAGYLPPASQWEDFAAGKVRSY